MICLRSPRIAKFRKGGNVLLQVAGSFCLLIFPSVGFPAGASCKSIVHRHADRVIDNAHPTVAEQEISAPIISVTISRVPAPVSD